MVFKKHLSKIGGRRGKVIKQKGKGASDYESDPMGQATGNYGKPDPEEAQPTAAMPSRIGMAGLGGGLGLGPQAPPDEEE